MRTIKFNPAARNEAKKARQWYARRSQSAPIRFMAELDHAVEEVASNPDRWAAYLHGTRCYKLGRFPYVLVYALQNGIIEIYAVAHTSRRPGYWRRRLR